MTSPTDIVRGESRGELTKEPSSIPSFVSTTPLLAALYAVFSGREEAGPALARVLTADAGWDTPLFTLDSSTEAADFLSTFLSFAIVPTIHFLSAKGEEDTLTFTWSVSFIYPLPWRPHVSVSGTSVATLQDGLVSHIEDDWYVPPFNLIVQALPTLTDFIWLWPAPHAENDAGTRRFIRKGKGYEIIKQAPHKEIRVRQILKDQEREMIWAVPSLPEEVFEGNLRRKELYSTVTPISVHKVTDDEHEWAIAVPGTLVGSSDVLVEPPTAENANVVDVGERTMAVVRFRGFSTREVVDERLERLIGTLVADGIIKDGTDIARGKVWVRSYDSKVGFNSKGFLSIAMHGATLGLPRLNELAVDLTDVIAADQVTNK